MVAECIIICVFIFLVNIHYPCLFLKTILEKEPFSATVPDSDFAVVPQSLVCLHMLPLNKQDVILMKWVFQD